MKFIKALYDNSDISDTVINQPSNYEFVELIALDYGQFKNGQKFDLMFAYSGYRNSGTLYLGNFNDGIVKWWYIAAQITSLM